MAKEEKKFEEKLENLENIVKELDEKLTKYKEQHQLFIEPESMELDTIYLQGFSTSMPIEIQDKMLRLLPGLKDCEVIKDNINISIYLCNRL